MSDYNIRQAFERIENELIESMIRNMSNHRAQEDEEGFQWEQWQAVQLKELEAYKRRNQKVFGKKFRDINEQLERAILKAREDGNMEQELELLEMVKTGKIKRPRATKKAAKTNAEFFKLNDRKMDALIRATVSDMEKAETAILRMANDKYRKVIFDAQVYANSGAGTYEKAVDMATKDFLSAGLNCVEYKNGARHTLKDYAEMALKTAAKRAYLTGEGEKRKEWGISTVIMNKRGNPCPQCLPWVGKILIDDVWSGGSAKDGDYPLMSTAIAANLYHPRCRDSHSTYFEGISTPPDDKFTKDDIEQIKDEYRLGQKREIARRNYEKYCRLADNSLDETNRRQYLGRAEYWKDQYGKYYRKEHNHAADLNQYQRYQGMLQELSPKSLEEFREIKYNDAEKWKDLKRKYRILNQYKIDHGNLTASEILKMDFDMVKDKRNSFNSKYKRSGNMAGVVVDGDNKYYIAHSQISDSNHKAYKGDNILVGEKESLRYEYIDVKKEDGTMRTETYHDTEAKIFEYLADLYEQKTFKRVDMLSERGMCDSCKNVMKQFEKEHPEVEINVVSNKRVEGDVWKRRLRKKK